MNTDLHVNSITPHCGKPPLVNVVNAVAGKIFICAHLNIITALILSP